MASLMWQKLLADIITCAEEVLTVVLRANDITDRSGGYLVMQSQGDAAPFLVLRVGVPNCTKYEKYFRLAMEKANRVLEGSDVSSFQSADPARQMYPGSIRNGIIATSFSGLPALADEAFCLLLNLRVGTMMSEEADAIAAISNNQFYHKAKPELGRPWIA